MKISDLPGYKAAISGTREELYELSVHCEVAAETNGTHEAVILNEDGATRYLIEVTDAPEDRMNILRKAADEEITGPRVYLLGKRIHHGAVGVALALFGAVLAYHDRRDWPWPFTDRS